MADKRTDLDLAYELGDAARLAWLEHGNDAWITVGRAIVKRLREVAETGMPYAWPEALQVRDESGRADFSQYQQDWQPAGPTTGETK